MGSFKLYENGKLPFFGLSFSFLEASRFGEERNDSLFMTSLFWCEFTEQTPLVALERIDPLEALSTSIWSHSSDEIFESSNFELEDSSDSFRWLNRASEDWRIAEEFDRLTEEFFWLSSRRRKFIVNNENFLIMILIVNSEPNFDQKLHSKTFDFGSISVDFTYRDSILTDLIQRVAHFKQAIMNIFGQFWVNHFKFDRFRPNYSMQPDFQPI